MNGHKSDRHLIDTSHRSAWKQAVAGLKQFNMEMTRNGPCSQRFVANHLTQDSAGSVHAARGGRCPINTFVTMTDADALRELQLGLARLTPGPEVRYFEFVTSRPYDQAFSVVAGRVGGLGGTQVAANIVTLPPVMEHLCLGAECRNSARVWAIDHYGGVRYESSYSFESTLDPAGVVRLQGCVVLPEAQLCEPRLVLPADPTAMQSTSHVFNPGFTTWYGPGFNWHWGMGEGVRAQRPRPAVAPEGASRGYGAK